MSEFSHIYNKRLINYSNKINNSSMCFRFNSILLLLGYGKISKLNCNDISLSKSYFKIPFGQPTSTRLMDIASLLSCANKKELDAFFKTSLYKNLKIHKNIYGELLNAIGYNENCNQIASFLYIYRIIEQIALCLPIVSIINKSSFEYTFNEYKQLINSNAKSDLSVLKNYSNNILDESIRDSSLSLNFSSTRKPEQNTYIVKKLLNSSDILNSTGYSIDIKYKYLDSLIINFRNQYFHYLFHDKNISSEDLEYPEDFLSVCNPYFINYFSFLYLDLLKSELSIWG